MNLNALQIGNLKPALPIIQGGMGVGISLHKLAGHVALNGGIGIISTAQIGFKSPDFIKDTLKANLNAIESELKKAREIAPKGIIGVNIMVAMKHYGEYVLQSIKSGAQLIISGAGLPIDLPIYAKGSSTALVPIVSSGKAAYIICRMWDRKHQVVPDAIVVEGPLAGGHLGFSQETLENPPEVLDLAKEVKTVVAEYEEKYKKRIPIVVAGGFFSGADVATALEAGADGVQMATRFVTTEECDASMPYKQSYIQAAKEDIHIIKSPVGMPGRAIFNDYIKNVPGNSACLYHCLQKCSVTDIPYCISSALIAAANGQTNKALLFCGSNAYKCTKLETVKAIIEEIKQAISLV